jgi:3-hydroxyacyl-[acyl-carrier-protein] dehydratase
MTLFIDQIKEIIPHRYPFLLVDKITELEIGKHAKGIKNVTVNEEYFNGHFPQFPVMPGVLILEALAQVAGVALLSQDEYKGRLAFFTGIDNARFRKQVRPGDTLAMEINVLSVRRGFVKVKAVAKVEDSIACEAELMFAIGEGK